MQIITKLYQTLFYHLALLGAILVGCMTKRVKVHTILVQSCFTCSDVLIKSNENFGSIPS